MADIAADGISKTFEDGFRALDDVSFRAASGEFVTLLGPSGCGKTTLLKVVAGFHAPSTGTVRIAGQDVTAIPPENRDTAMCFQSYALFPHLTVTENIEFGPRQKRIAKSERDGRLSELLRQVDLAAHATKLPNALSGGQQQRVALARALAMRPGIVLFDEPLSNLDAKLREQVRFEIRALQRQHGFTALYVTHDQAEALAMSDRILVMRAGRVEQAGTPEEIYHAPRTSFVADFVGAANILSGKVLGTDGDGHWRVATEMGELSVATDRTSNGAPVNLCWRPEDAEIASLQDDHPAGDNTVDAPIVASAFQGAWTDLVVTPREAPAKQLRLQVAAGSTAIADGRVRFHVAPHKIKVLEDQP